MDILKRFKKTPKVQEEKGPSQEVIDANQEKVALHMKTAFDKAIRDYTINNGKKLVTSASKNGNGWTVYITNPSDANRPGFGILYQVDINLTGKGGRLHYQDGPYGKDINNSLEEAGSFTAGIIQKIQKYLQPELTT